MYFSTFLKPKYLVVSPCSEHELNVQNFLKQSSLFCGCVLIIACSSFAIQINDITLNSRWLSCSRESEASQGNIFLYRGLGDSKPPRFQEETEDTWNLYLLCAIELCLLYGLCCLIDRFQHFKTAVIFEKSSLLWTVENYQHCYDRLSLCRSQAFSLVFNNYRVHA